MLRKATEDSGAEYELELENSKVFFDTASMDGIGELDSPRVFNLFRYPPVGPVLESATVRGDDLDGEVVSDLVEIATYGTIKDE